MKKYLLLLIIILFFSQPSFAHTYLKEANPTNNEEVVEKIENITLVFETKIENGSFEVVNENGISFNLNISKVNNDTLVGILTNVLPNGLYTVNWNIIGADGHPIDGSYAFKVNVPESDDCELIGTDECELTNEDGNGEVKKVPKEQGNNIKNKPLDPLFTNAIVVILIFLLFTSIWYVRKKRD